MYLGNNRIFHALLIRNRGGYTGDYSSNERYYKGDIVTYNGNVYEAQETMTEEGDRGNPEEDVMYWKKLNAPLGQYKGEWVEWVSYSENDIVTEDGNVYRCLIDNCVEYRPSEYKDMCWEQLNTASGGGGAYKGEFEWSASYVEGDVVTSNGDVYLVTCPTPNGVPSIEYFGWTKLNG